IRKAMTCNGRPSAPTPRRQQNAERSAEGTRGGSAIQAAKCLTFNPFGSGHLLAFSFTPEVAADLSRTRESEERRGHVRYNERNHPPVFPGRNSPANRNEYRNDPLGF